MLLRDYQTRTVEMIRAELRKGFKKVLVTLPTGGGKTHILASITDKSILNGHKVIAMMHRRQLVTQMRDRFQECGIDASLIMAGEDYDLECQAQIVTTQTYGRRLKLDAVEWNPFFVDAKVVLIDEAHHALSKTYQDILLNYPDKIIIGVTATPALSTGVGMGNYFDTLIQPVGVQELIDMGHLVPGVYYGPSDPDLSKVRTVAGDYEKKGLDRVMNQPKLIGDVVYNWLKIADNRRTMVFAVNVKHSKALQEEFGRKGIPAEHLDAHSQDEIRADTLERFRSGETRVLCNVGLYTEGTDIPEIECIVLARPTKSDGLFRQMVGRGARPYPGKEKFIVIDHGGNIKRLGFYEDDIEWSLDGRGPAAQRKKKPPKEKTPMICEMCSFVFTGPKCPQCGTEVKFWGKKIEAVEAELQEIKRGKVKNYTTDEKRQWYMMFLSEKERLGKTHSWLLAQYKSKFGVWPRNMDSLTPVQADLAVLNWLKSQRIRYAKRMAKEKAQQSLVRGGELAEQFQARG
uniref:Putative type III restriction enzyme n=1 Tax=viral metagenome TaxID=1070528 RepID=A0A6M3JMT0_9ZZZZ